MTPPNASKIFSEPELTDLSGSMNPLKPLDNPSKVSSLNAERDPIPQAAVAAASTPSVAFNVPSEGEANDTAAAGNAARKCRSTLDEDSETDLQGLLALLGEDDYELFEVAPGSGAKKLSTSPVTKGLRAHKRPFLIRRKTAQKIAQEQARFTGSAPQVADGEVDQLDYEKRFRPDEKGKEKEPNARVWRVYLNEAGQFDINMIENMRDTVDVILVFAALFSAIVTTLVALTATALQLDHPQVTNRLLMELIALQRIAITSGSIDQVYPSPLNADSHPSSTANIPDYWINGLWFTSLAFSLSTALIAVLVRQWIQAYEAPSFQGTPKARAEVRGFRYYGIETWHVPLIIGLLPSLLHLSLFLFFAGLVVFLFTLNEIIAYVVTGIISTVLTTYVITNLLPVWYASCPYKTPLSQYTSSIGQYCKAAYSWIWNSPHWTAKAFVVFMVALYLPIALVIRLPWYCFTYSAHADDFDGFMSFWVFWVDPLSVFIYKMDVTQRRSSRDMEMKAIIAQGKALHTCMFTWLMQTSSNPSARSIVTSSIGLDLEDLLDIQPPCTSNVEWRKLLQQSISAQVTNPHVTLDLDSFDAYANISGIHPYEFYTHKLLSAHQYSVQTGLHFVDEQAYDVSSYVDWGHDSQSHPQDQTSMMLSGVFLQRFFLHAIYHVTPISPVSLASLLDDREVNVPLLQSLMRVVRSDRVINPTTKALRRLKPWFPTPDHADLVFATVSEASELLPLLAVANHLLRYGGMQFSDMFRDAGCLGFWHRIFERYHSTVTQLVADEVNTVIDLYVDNVISCTEVQQREEHLPNLFNHLDAVCIWAAAYWPSALSWSLIGLMYMDPDNAAWERVQVTLVDSLPTHVTKKAGARFLKRLNTRLREEQEKARLLRADALPQRTSTIELTDTREDDDRPATAPNHFAISKPQAAREEPEKFESTGESDPFTGAAEEEGGAAGSH